ncbi:MAG: hypothetical protein LC798_20800, partial [Chloroflexi bacterium]|nr:hypothetical protein [Chloroflexota bacterium]
APTLNGSVAVLSLVGLWIVRMTMLHGASRLVHVDVLLSALQIKVRGYDDDGEQKHHEKEFVQDATSLSDGSMHERASPWPL